jgi:glycosyltransferase involved in cell wall biosynthesis
MTIVYISTFFPLRGGIAHFNSLLYQKFTERGHTVKAITFSRQYPKLLFPGKTQDEQGTEAEAYKTNAEILLDSINPFTWIRTAFRAMSHQPDMILFKYWIPFFAPCYFTIALFVRLFSKAKVIYILDNFKPHEKRFGDGVLLWLATRFTHGYIAMSELVERDLRAYLPNAVYEKSPHPIYNIFGDAIPKADARKKLGLDASKKILLFFGYIRKYKGLDVLLDAMPHLVKELPDVQLLVVGEFYGDEADYRKKIAALNLPLEAIKVFSDYVPNDKVGEYFSAADVAVLPYRSATQSGIVQIAYQFGRPCIVTNVGGLSEVVIDGKTGFVIEPNSPQAITNSVKKFYDGAYESEFARHITEEKKKYSWDNFAAALETLITRLK